MTFGFGAAKALYARNVHPRVFLGPQEVSKLRRQVRTGRGKVLMDSLREKVKPLVERVLGAADVPRFLLENAGQLHPFYWADLDLAMVGVLDEDERALNAIDRVLWAYPEMQKIQGPDHWPLDGRYSHTSAAYDMVCGRWTTEQRRAFATWAAHNAYRLAQKWCKQGYLRSASNNGIISGATCPLMMMLAVMGEPGVGDLAAPLRLALTMVEATFHTEIGPDGYPSEDIGYGSMVVADLAVVAEALRRAGIYDINRRCPGYARFGRAMLHFVQPWGRHLTNTGDHSDTMGVRAFALARLAEQTRDPALLWLLGTLSYPAIGSNSSPAATDENRQYWAEIKLAKGFGIHADAMSLLVLDELKKPARRPGLAEPTQFMDRGRGIVSFRTSWKDDATYVVFDGSHRTPSAPGHMHATAGSFILSALGEYFAVHGGRYCTDQDQQNVVLIDGKNGYDYTVNGDWGNAYRHGNLTAYRPGRFVDSAAADSSQEHNCYWARRTLGLVKGVSSYVWLADDINKANDWAEFWWQLHTSPENVITLGERTATIKGWRQGNLLDVHFVLPALDAYPRPHTIEMTQGEVNAGAFKQYGGQPNERTAVYARPSDMLHYSLFVRPRVVAKISGYNGRVMSLLLPRRQDEPPARVERLPSLDNSLAVKINFGKVEDTVIFAYEHHLLEAGDVVARGNWCVVRRSTKSGKVLDYAVDDGTSLQVDGRELLKIGHQKTGRGNPRRKR